MQFTKDSLNPWNVEPQSTLLTMACCWCSSATWGMNCGLGNASSSPYSTQADCWQLNLLSSWRSADVTGGKYGTVCCCKTLVGGDRETLKSIFPSCFSWRSRASNSSMMLMEGLAMYEGDLKHPLSINDDDVLCWGVAESDFVLSALCDSDMCIGWVGWLLTADCRTPSIATSTSI